MQTAYVYILGYHEGSLSFYKQSSHSCLHHPQAPLSPFLLSPDLPTERPVPPWKFLHAWLMLLAFLAVFFSNFSNTRPPWVFVSNLPILLSVYATCFFQGIRITLSKACPSTVCCWPFPPLGTFSSQFPWYYIAVPLTAPLGSITGSFLLPSWLSLKVKISQKRGWMSLENQQAGHLLTNPFRASPKSTGHSWSPWRGAQGLLVLWLPAFSLPNPQPSSHPLCPSPLDTLTQWQRRPSCCLLHDPMQTLLTFYYILKPSPPAPMWGVLFLLGFLESPFTGAFTSSPCYLVLFCFF